MGHGRAHAMQLISLQINKTANIRNSYEFPGPLMKIISEGKPRQTWRGQTISTG
jgi:hypothetical protein